LRWFNTEDVFAQPLEVGLLTAQEQVGNGQKKRPWSFRKLPSKGWGPFSIPISSTESPEDSIFSFTEKSNKGTGPSEASFVAIDRFGIEGNVEVGTEF